MKYCKQCGASNSNNNKTCETCGVSLDEQNFYILPAANQAIPAPPKDKDETTLWLVLNIVCALFCCQILGIIGAVYAGVAKTSYKQGNIGDAESKVQTSKTLFIIGVILGGIITTILFASRARFF